jgi:predicted acyltransferase
MKRDGTAARLSSRLASIDAFRGFTILAMLIVNNKAPHAPVPEHLTHAMWSGGVNFADLIFPWFILLVGISIPFSSRAGAGTPAWRRFADVSRRAFMLVLLGCLINSSYAGHPIFDFGVLQLIGISYFFAALADGLSVRNRVAIAAALLAAHWAALRFIPIPGVGAGIFTEHQNFIRYMNENYFEPFGLDGVLSVATTTALALIGTAVGVIPCRRNDAPARIGWKLIGLGAALALGGWLWGFDLPLNKPLWTSSYIVFAAGLGTLAFGVFYLTIDAWNRRRWAFPLVVFGTNALVAFVAPVLVNIHILREWVAGKPGTTSVTIQQYAIDFMFSHFGRLAGGWIYLLIFVLAWWLVFFAMYRRRIFIRV